MIYYGILTIFGNILVYQFIAYITWLKNEMTFGVKVTGLFLAYAFFWLANFISYVLTDTSVLFSNEKVFSFIKADLLWNKLAFC